MSEDNNRYKNGKIYTFRNINDNNLIYVGSTIQPLYKRFHGHKNNCFNEKSKEYNKILYKQIRETNNINDWYIELYENYPTESKELLLKREGEIIREIGTLNKVVNGRTSKEYYNDNKNKISERHKEYQKEYDKIKVICSCGEEVNKHHIKRHKRSNKHNQLLKEKEQENNIIK